MQNNIDAQDLILAAVGAQILKTAASTTKILLAKADFDDTDPNLHFADFTEADFVGYTAGGVLVAAWDGPFIDAPSGREWLNPTAVVSFVAGVVVGSQTIYGWYMDNGTGVLLDCGKFDVPIVINTQFQTIQIFPHFFISGPDGPDALED
jgi:hypothetical protein